MRALDHGEPPALSAVGCPGLPPAPAAQDTGSTLCLSVSDGVLETRDMWETRYPYNAGQKAWLCSGERGSADRRPGSGAVIVSTDSGLGQSANHSAARVRISGVGLIPPELFRSRSLWSLAGEGSLLGPLAHSTGRCRWLRHISSHAFLPSSPTSHIEGAWDAESTVSMTTAGLCRIT